MEGEAPESIPPALNGPDPTRHPLYCIAIIGDSYIDRRYGCCPIQLATLHTVDDRFNVGPSDNLLQGFGSKCLHLSYEHYCFQSYTVWIVAVVFHPSKALPQREGFTVSNSQNYAK